MEKKKKIKKSLPAPTKLKILITIVSRPKAEFYLDVIESFDVNLQTVIYGKGTAGNRFDYLGFNDNEKAIIISIVKEDKMNDLLYELNDKFKKVRNGKGIAYSIPISSVIGVLIYQFLSGDKKDTF